MPCASSTWRARNAVVVLPLVPVTPITRNSAVGLPWNAAASGPIAARTLGTTTSGTSRPSGRSQTTAAAPRLTASAANSCPSTTNPGTQKRRPRRDALAPIGQARDLGVAARIGSAGDPRGVEQVAQRHRDRRF